MFHFHIGTHKTGSTTLQRFLLRNRAILAEAGLDYPDIGMFLFGQHRLAFTFLRNEMSPDGPASEPVAALAAWAAAHPDRTALVSSEAFEDLGPAAVRRLVDSVRPHEVRVFLYVRDFTRLVPSRYAQKTKVGGSLDDFDSFFAGGGAKAQAYDAAARWAAVVGWPNVRVRALDARSLDPGGLLADALRAVEIDPAVLARCDPASLEMVNETPHWLAVEAVRAIGVRLTADGHAWRPGMALKPRTRRPEQEGRRQRDVSRLVRACQAAVAAAGLADRPGQYLTPEQFALLAGRYQADVERLAAAGVAPRLPDAVAEPPPPRQFLPSIDALAHDERRALRDALAETAQFQFLDGPLSDAMLAAIWDGPRSPAGKAGKAPGRTQNSGEKQAGRTQKAGRPTLGERLGRLFGRGAATVSRPRRRRREPPASPR